MKLFRVEPFFNLIFFKFACGFIQSSCTRSDLKEVSLFDARSIFKFLNLLLGIND